MVILRRILLFLAAVTLVCECCGVCIQCLQWCIVRVCVCVCVTVYVCKGFSVPKSKDDVFLP